MKFALKVISTVLILSLLFLTAAVGANASEQIALGDVNGDGSINLLDALTMLKQITNDNLNSDQKIAADVNRDGNITSLDALWTLQFLSGRRASLGFVPKNTGPADPAPTEPDPVEPGPYEIPFKIGVNVDVLSRNDGVYAKLATSSEQLKEIYMSEHNPYNTLLNYIAKYEYNERFFEENAIIVVFIANNYPCKNTVKSLVRNGSQLNIEVSTFVSSGFYTAVLRYYRILLEVKKSDIEGVTDIICNRTFEYEQPLNP